MVCRCMLLSECVMCWSVFLGVVKCETWCWGTIHLNSVGALRSSSDATFPEISGIPDIGKSIRLIRKPSGNPTNREFLLNEVVKSHHAESSGNFVRLLWHPWCSFVCTRWMPVQLSVSLSKCCVIFSQLLFLCQEEIRLGVDQLWVIFFSFFSFAWRHGSDEIFVFVTVCLWSVIFFSFSLLDEIFVYVTVYPWTTQAILFCSWRSRVVVLVWIVCPWFLAQLLCKCTLDSEMLLRIHERTVTIFTIVDVLFCYTNNCWRR